MTADHNAAARERLDTPVAEMMRASAAVCMERDCGREECDHICMARYEAFTAYADRARQEGRREGLEEAALRVDALHKEFAATAVLLSEEGEAEQLKELRAEMCALEYARGCIQALATGKE